MKTSVSAFKSVRLSWSNNKWICNEICYRNEAFNCKKLCMLTLFQPAGVFVLENSNIQYEVCTGVPFAFSMTFRDEPDRKHLFSGRSEDYIHQWVTAIKQATYVNLNTWSPWHKTCHFVCFFTVVYPVRFRYGHWRSQLVILQTKISVKTGKVKVPFT
jgi:hypothetical protein